MSKVETVKRELAQARDMVNKFRATLAAGSEVDYDQFNSVIESACSKAVALPFDQVAEIRTDLIDLLEQLNIAKTELSAVEAADEATGAPLG